MSQVCPYCQFQLEPFAISCPGCEQNKARQAARTTVAPIAPVAPQLGHPAVRQPAHTSFKLTKGIPSGAKWMITGFVMMLGARLVFTLGMMAMRSSWDPALGAGNASDAALKVMIISMVSLLGLPIGALCVLIGFVILFIQLVRKSG